MKVKTQLEHDQETLKSLSFRLDVFGQKHLSIWARRLYAKSLGYFWVSCKRCGRMFGGNECRHSESIDTRKVALTDADKQADVYKMEQGTVVCPLCTQELLLKKVSHKN